MTYDVFGGTLDLALSIYPSLKAWSWSLSLRVQSLLTPLVMSAVKSGKCCRIWHFIKCHPSDTSEPCSHNILTAERWVFKIAHLALRMT